MVRGPALLRRLHCDKCCSSLCHLLLADKKDAPRRDFWKAISCNVSGLHCRCLKVQRMPGHSVTRPAGRPTDRPTVHRTHVTYTDIPEMLWLPKCFLQFARNTTPPPPAFNPQLITNSSPLAMVDVNRIFKIVTITSGSLIVRPCHKLACRCAAEFCA